jgi:hypothetical protein
MSDPLKSLKEALVVSTQKLNEFVAARAEIDNQRAAIDAQIIHWKQLVDSLRTVCAEEEEDPSDVEVSAFVEGKPGKQTVKFTDGVRMVFKERRDAILTAPDVRTGLTNLGFDFSKYQQPLTPIHNCLKRLEEQGEIKAEKFPGGRIVGYKWISPIERALDDENSYYEVLGTGIIQGVVNAQRDAQRMAEMHRATVEADQRAAMEAAQRVIAVTEAIAQPHTKKPKKG